MPHAYTEDQVVEQPAIGLFAELGWVAAGPLPNVGAADEPRDAGLIKWLADNCRKYLMFSRFLFE